MIISTQLEIHDYFVDIEHTFYIYGITISSLPKKRTQNKREDVMKVQVVTRYD